MIKLFKNLDGSELTRLLLLLRAHALINEARGIRLSGLPAPPSSSGPTRPCTAQQSFTPAVRSIELRVGGAFSGKGASVFAHSGKPLSEPSKIKRFTEYLKFLGGENDEKQKLINSIRYGWHANKKR